MKFSAFVLALVLILSLASSNFSQNFAQPVTAKDEETLIQRINLIKADVLQDIQTFRRKDQARYYTELGNIIWEYDQKEADFWFGKGVELGINPATEYRDDSEKLRNYWNLLSFVLEENDALADKLISKIKEIKIDESKLEILEDANKTYITIAQQVLSRKKDVNLAFEFALLSLKGKKPAINDISMRFLWELRFVNENFSNTYFAKLKEAAANSGNVWSLVYYLFESGFDTIANAQRRDMPELQKKEIFELMLDNIQKEFESLSLKKINSCYTLNNWGLKYSEDFKKFSPAKFPIVEKATAVCQNANIEHWKKPDFYKKPHKTSLDFANWAKEITDKKTQANYLTQASSIARTEKNFTFSNSILDNIDKEFHDSFWVWNKIETNSKLIEELFKTDNFDEITKILNNTPQEYRPFIILGGLRWINTLKSNQKDFILDLMNQAEVDFYKLEGISPKTNNFAINLTQFGQLTTLYVRLGYYQQAVAMHEKSILFLNRIIKNIPSEELDKNYYRYVMPYSYFIFQLPQGRVDLINEHFQTIYENIGKIEYPRTRIFERLMLLRKTFEKLPKRKPGN